MGSILKGHDTELNRDLAIKVLLERHRDNSELVRRFVEEAQIGGQLQHPGIVPIHELGVLADQRPFFAMKLVKGRTLTELLSERWPVGWAPPTGLTTAAPDGGQCPPYADLPHFLSIFEAVCQTMAYAHARGVIHRDLKPSNVMVGSFGEVQVMDWGLAKVLPRGDDERGTTPEPDVPVSVIHTARFDSDANVSTAGSVLGTPGYMSPEQARGELDQVDERADVFGLGAILCEILTGAPAFVSRIQAETIRMAGRGELAEPSARLEACGADPELIALAKDCLGAEREDRPRRAGVVAERMTAHLSGVQERLRKAELERAAADARAAEERKRRKLALGLAAAMVTVVILGGGGAAIYFQQRRDQAGKLDLALRVVDLLVAQAEADPEGDPAKWHSAQEAVKRAEDLLGPLLDAKAQLRVRELAKQVAVETEAAGRDAKLLREVTEIRLAKPEERDALADDAAYARAFREAGIDVDALGSEAAAARIKARPAAVALALSAALDDWTIRRRGASEKDADGWTRLVATVRAAEPDPNRDRLRQVLLEPDRKVQRQALLQLARTVDPKDWAPASLTLLADTLRNAGANEAAADFLRRAQLVHPGDLWINWGLANLLANWLRPRQYEEAIRYFSVARALRPEASMSLAIALHRMGRVDEAIVVVRDMTRLRPESLNWIFLAQFLKSRRDFAGADAALEKGVAAIREAIRQKPDSLSAYQNLGEVLLAQRKRDEAIAVFREALRIKPGDASVLYSLVRSLKGQGKLDEAVATYRDSVRLEPDNVSLRENLAFVFIAQGKHEEAIAGYREAVRRKPDSSSTRNLLGWALFRQGNLVEAIAEFREAIRLRPALPRYHMNLGDALSGHGKEDEAIAEFREAIRLEPYDASSHARLGSALRAQGKVDEAIAEYREAIDLGPYGGDLNGLVGVLLTQKKFAAAAEEYRKARELAKGDPSTVRAYERERARIERLAIMGPRLPAVLRGEDRPKNAVEGVDSAYFAYHTQRFAPSARLFAEAFRSDPKLTEDMEGWNRYNAACSAALAGAGKGENKPPLDENEKVRWRKQALDWLEADLGYWTNQGDTGPAPAKSLLRQTSRHWKDDADLAGIRDEWAVRGLPTDEQKACRGLWAQVDQLLKQAGQ